MSTELENLMFSLCIPVAEVFVSFCHVRSRFQNPKYSEWNFASRVARRKDRTVPACLSARPCGVVTFTRCWVVLLMYLQSQVTVYFTW